MEEIIKKINDNESTYKDYPNFRKYYLENKDIVFQFDKRDVFVFIHEHYLFYAYNGLRNCLPELWKDFTIEDWCYIIKKIKRNPNPNFWTRIDSTYGDIEFLCKYLKIDAFDILNEIDMNEQDKYYIVSYWWYSKLIFLTERDSIETHLSYEEINTLSYFDDYSEDFLKKNPNIKKFNYIDGDSDALYEYLNSLKNSYMNKGLKEIIIDMHPK